VKHDLAKEPPSRALLERLIDESHLADFVNTRSPAYKERGLDVTTMTKKQAIDLMMEEPNLIKRPLVMRGADRAVFGWKPDLYEEVLGE
jgi:arsenate reductase-like glutaredoxin family protein